jgi:hypothetical protein
MANLLTGEPWTPEGKSSALQEEPSTLARDVVAGLTDETVDVDDDAALYVMSLKAVLGDAAASKIFNFVMDTSQTRLVPLSEEKLKAMWDAGRETLEQVIGIVTDLFGERPSAGDRDIILRRGGALMVMAMGITWEQAGVLLGQPRTTTRRAILDVLQRIARRPIPNEARAQVLPFIPEATYLVDCFPVRCRGSAAQFNGKYHTKIFKYQAVTDLNGNVVSVLPAGRGKDRSHDSHVWKRIGAGVPLEQGQILLGDKAYQGCAACVAPYKRVSAKKLDLKKLRFNKVHQLCRTHVERLFARLHAWSVIRYSGFSRKTTDVMVKAVAWLDAQKRQDTARYVQPRPEDYDFGTPCDPDAVRSLTTRYLPDFVDVTTLVGKASKNRKRGTPAVKAGEGWSESSSDSGTRRGSDTEPETEYDSDGERVTD